MKKSVIKLFIKWVCLWVFACFYIFVCSILCVLVCICVCVFVSRYNYFLQEMIFCTYPLKNPVGTLRWKNVVSTNNNGVSWSKRHIVWKSRPTSGPTDVSRTCPAKFLQPIHNHLSIEKICLINVGIPNQISTTILKPNFNRNATKITLKTTLR